MSSKQPSQPTQTTQTTKTEPWDGAKGPLLDQYAIIQRLSAEGVPNYYPGQTVIDQSKATTDALSQAEALARDPNASSILANGANAVNAVQTGATFSNQPNNTYSALQGNLSPAPNQFSGTYAALARGGQMPGMQQLGAMAGYTDPALAGAAGMAAAGSNNVTNPGYSAVAGGSMLGKNAQSDALVRNINQGVIDQYKSSVAPGIDSTYALGGRSRSGAAAAAHGNAEASLYDTLAKNATSVYQQDYNMERGYQEAARGALSNNYNTDWANTQGALSTLSGMSGNQNAARLAAIGQRQQGWNSDVSNRLNAANGGTAANATQYQNMLAGLGLNLDAAKAQTAADATKSGAMLQGAGMAGDAYSNQYLPAQNLAAVGASQDAYKDLLLQADIAKWDQNQNKQWDNAARAVSLYTGGGYNTATTTKPVQQQSTNGFGQALGAVGSIASLFGMLCDVRVKRNIKSVGALGNGIRMYEFEYIDKPGVKQIGPMAQEVEVTHPHAVHMMHGLKVVDMNAIMEMAA